MCQEVQFRYLFAFLHLCIYLLHLCQIGHVVLTSSKYSDFGENLRPLVPLHCQLATLEALALCVKMNWMAIVVRVIFLYGIICDWT